jgi:hypothetical protein
MIQQLCDTDASESGNSLCEISNPSTKSMSALVLNKTNMLPRAILRGRGDELIDLAQTNLLK